SEVVRLKEYLEEKFDVEITEEKLREACRLENEIRSAKKKLASVMRHDPAPVSGMDLFKVFYGSSFKFDREAIPGEIRAVAEKIEEEYASGKMLPKKPRIILTGCPIGGVTEKVIKAIEDNGGVIVAYESCSGAKSFDRNVDLEAEDIYEALSRRYLDIGCSVMTPDTNRFELLKSLIDEFKADGVVEMTLQACHTYNVESKSIERLVKGCGLPYMSVETDYSLADVGQLNTRIAAFVEML
ncbi:MAG: 2-hydroxyacyl-CoA dehydratase family protein, partial [Firmicutes bacterium]|nr:2-hydroxyacyl-CoA dehydratase family protein [Bacillota bacterium]